MYGRCFFCVTVFWHGGTYRLAVERVGVYVPESSVHSFVTLVPTSSETVSRLLAHNMAVSQMKLDMLRDM